MASKSKITQDSFIFSFRADCLDCQKYVGPKRDNKQDALDDAKDHNAIPEFKDHQVETEVTQTYHIA